MWSDEPSYLSAAALDALGRQDPLKFVDTYVRLQAVLASRRCASPPFADLPPFEGLSSAPASPRRWRDGDSGRGRGGRRDRGGGEGGSSSRDGSGDSSVRRRRCTDDHDHDPPDSGRDGEVADVDADAGRMERGEKSIGPTSRRRPSRAKKTSRQERERERKGKRKKGEGGGHEKEAGAGDVVDRRQVLERRRDARRAKAFIVQDRSKSAIARARHMSEGRAAASKCRPREGEGSDGDGGSTASEDERKRNRSDGDNRHAKALSRAQNRNEGLLRLAREVERSKNVGKTSRLTLKEPRLGVFNKGVASKSVKTFDFRGRRHGGVSDLVFNELTFLKPRARHHGSWARDESLGSKGGPSKSRGKEKAKEKDPASLHRAEGREQKRKRGANEGEAGATSRFFDRQPRTVLSLASSDDENPPTEDDRPGSSSSKCPEISVDDDSDGLTEPLERCRLLKEKRTRHADGALHPRDVNLASNSPGHRLIGHHLTDTRSRHFDNEPRAKRRRTYPNASRSSNSRTDAAARRSISPTERLIKACERGAFSEEDVEADTLGNLKARFAITEERRSSPVRSPYGVSHFLASPGPPPERIDSFTKAILGLADSQDGEGGERLDGAEQELPEDCRDAHPDPACEVPVSAENRQDEGNMFVDGEYPGGQFYVPTFAQTGGVPISQGAYFHAPPLRDDAPQPENRLLDNESALARYSPTLAQLEGGTRTFEGPRLESEELRGFWRPFRP